MRDRSFPTRAAWGACAAAALLGLGACTTTKQKTPSLTSTSSNSSGIGDAVTQPVRDLGIQKDKPPEILVKAARDPYAPPPATCPAIADEITALDAVLGRDVDEAPAKGQGNVVGDLAADAVRSATSLPFRGVIRRMTGAERRAVEMRKAVLAGTARRAYLKGMRGAQGCDNPAPIVAETTPPPVAVVPPVADAAEATVQPVIAPAPPEPAIPAPATPAP